VGAPDDPPLILQAFEPDYILPDYRATERSDGAVVAPAPAATVRLPVLDGDGVEQRAEEQGAFPGPPALLRALEDVVAPWVSQSGGEVRIAGVLGGTGAACLATLDAGGADGLAARPIGTAEFLRLIAHAGASGGVHGRRRGGASGRSSAWWVARCATGLEREETIDPDELEFRMEDLDLLAFRTTGEAAWRLEVAIGGRSGRAGGVAPDEAAATPMTDAAGWAVAVAAFDRSSPEEPGQEAAAVDGPPADGAPW
jgi:hypothetical protein